MPFYEEENPLKGCFWGSHQSTALVFPPARSSYKGLTGPPEPGGSI